MTRKYLDMVFTDSVKKTQEELGVRAKTEKQRGSDFPDQQLSSREQAFIGARDSFYMASVLETGWPYLQHRGGPPGFLKVLDDRTLAFADFRGNLQYVTVGSVKGNDRVALFLMDYLHQMRLKIMARLEFVEAEDEEMDADQKSALFERVTDPGYKGKVERVGVLRVEAFDWNCSQHITPRFTEEQAKAYFSADDPGSAP